MVVRCSAQNNFWQVGEYIAIADYFRSGCVVENFRCVHGPEDFHVVCPKSGGPKGAKLLAIFGERSGFFRLSSGGNCVQNKNSSKPL
jgi:hypothetical protein